MFKPYVFYKFEKKFYFYFTENQADTIFIDFFSIDLLDLKKTSSNFAVPKHRHSVNKNRAVKVK